MNFAFTGADTHNDSIDVGDDEQNDPEFNYLEEAETEELDEEDFRFDKPFRVPRMILNDLFSYYLYLNILLNT